MGVCGCCQGHTWGTTADVLCRPLAYVRRLGADLSVDVPIQYLSVFMNDDAAFDDLCRKYAAGAVTTGEVKRVAIDVIAQVVARHKEARAALTAETLALVKSVRPLFPPKK